DFVLLYLDAVAGVRHALRDPEVEDIGDRTVEAGSDRGRSVRAHRVTSAACVIGKARRHRKHLALKSKLTHHGSAGATADAATGELALDDSRDRGVRGGREIDGAAGEDDR